MNDYNSYQNTPPTIGAQGAATPTAGASGGGGNWFENLAPTAGGVLGNVIGDVAGPIGGIAGGAIGSAAGQGLEDLFTGANTHNMVPAALQGGIGGGIGAIGGGILGGIGKLAVGAGSKAAATAVDPAIQAGLDKAAADAAATAARTQNIHNEFGQAMPGADEATNKDLKSALDLADKMGVDSSKPGTAQGMQDVGAAATGPGGEINLVKQGLLRQAGPVNTDGLASRIRGIIENNLGIVNNNPASSVGSGLNAGTKLYNELNVANAIPDAPRTDPDQAFKTIQNISAATRKADSEARVNPLTGQPSEGAVQKAQTMHLIKSEVENTIYGDGTANSMRPDLDQLANRYQTSPEQIIQENKNVQALPEDQQKLVANDIATKLNYATNMPDILKAEQPYVGMAKIGQDAVKTNDSAQQTSASVTRDNAMAKAAADAAEAPGKEEAANAKQNSTVVGTAGKVAGHALSGNHGMALAEILNHFKNGNGGAVLGDIARGGGTVLGKATNSKIGKIAGSSAAQLLAHAPDFQPNNPSALTAATTGGDMQTGGTGPGDLLAQLDTMMTADPLLASALAPQITALMQKNQQLVAAQQAVGGYQNTLQAAGGGQGPIGGTLAKLGGLMGGPAGQVGPQAQAAEQALAAAGVTGVQLPGLTSTSGGVQAGMQNAQGILQQLGAQ